jgi:hypothetical protein
MARGESAVTILLYRGIIDGSSCRLDFDPHTRDPRTVEYGTDPRMSAGWRVTSNMKDAVGCFGLRAAFRRPADRRPPDRP